MTRDILAAAVLAACLVLLPVVGMAAPPGMIDAAATLIAGIVTLAFWCLILVVILEAVTFPFRLVAGHGLFLTRFIALAIVVASAGWWFASAVSAAAPAQCDLALILANDASSSMKAEQKALVRKGTADALRSPDLAFALAGSSAWIMVIEWSYGVEVLANWTRIDSPADLAALADRTEAGAPTGSQTNMGSMFRKAREFFDARPCSRQVLDVMTDGDPTYSPRQARDESFVEGTHTVNVIFVGTKPESIARMETEARFGWGGFVMPVARFEDFPAAMRRKLMLEVSWALTGRHAG